MNLSKTSPEPTKKETTADKLAVYSVGGQVGCATVLVILLGLIIGLALDRLLGTENQHVMVLIFVLGAGPLALVISYFLAMRAVKQATQKREAEKTDEPVQEDEKRE